MNAAKKFVPGTCAWTGERLSDVLDGELAGWRGLAAHRHLARCDRCRALLAALGRVVALLGSERRATERDAPSAADAVVARIRAEKGAA